MSLIADPHPNVEVAVTGTSGRGTTAHRREVKTWTEKHHGQDVMRAAYAASCTGETARSLSFGWADHLGAEICTHPKCFPHPIPWPLALGRESAADRLWMATRRRGLDHHRLPAAATKTGCGRYAGPEAKGEYDNGLVLTADEVAELESKPCRRCWPEVGRG